MNDLQLPPTEAEIADIARLPDPVCGVVRRLAFQRDLLAAENARLREALARIANYGEDGICPYGCDTPHIACAALAASEPKEG